MCCCTFTSTKLALNIFSTADTCHRESQALLTDCPNSHDSVTISMHITRTLKLKQLNGIINFISYTCASSTVTCLSWKMSTSLTPNSMAIWQKLINPTIMLKYKNSVNHFEGTYHKCPFFMDEFGPSPLQVTVVFITVHLWNITYTFKINY